MGWEMVIGKKGKEKLGGKKTQNGRKDEKQAREQETRNVKTDYAG